MLKNISIRYRIAYGYALVLGIAISGTLLGLSAGNRYQRHAYQVYETTTTEYQLLTQLQVKILYNRPAKQLSPYLADRDRFTLESQALLSRITDIEETLARLLGLEEDTASTTSYDQHEEIIELLHRYEETLSAFEQRTDQFIQSVTPLLGAPSEAEAAQLTLLEFVRSSEFAEFIQFPDQLVSFAADLEVEIQAAGIALQQAKVIRTQIILGSLLASTAIAVIIALWTSDAIARPLTTLTKTAQHITEKRDFDVQVPIVGNNEVGLLANSFNQLIHQVNVLLAEITQKNTNLTDALNQVHSENMSSLWQLVAGVAHEINNPVSFIHGNISHIRKHLDDVVRVITKLQTHCPEAISELEAKYGSLDLDFIREDIGKILASMEVGTHRIQTIVLSLRNFSRLDEAEYKRVDIHEGIESSLLILQHRLKATPNRPSIEVHHNYDKNLPLVECYPGQLNQVMLNVLINAVDALDKQSQKTAGDEDSIPLQITVTTRAVGQDEVEIVITDTGIGMTEAIRSKIFEQFFTTKPKNVGTGIGLSISDQIVTELHHGKIHCTSTPGIGTEFVIRIPMFQPDEYPNAACNCRATSEERAPLDRS